MGWYLKSGEVWFIVDNERDTVADGCVVTSRGVIRAFSDHHDDDRCNVKQHERNIAYIQLMRYLTADKNDPYNTENFEENCKMAA